MVAYESYLSIESHLSLQRFLDQVMGPEDFSYYQTKIPGVFFFLGSGNREKGVDLPHNSSKFNVDEGSFPTEVSMLAGFAVKRPGSCTDADVTK